MRKDYENIINDSSGIIYLSDSLDMKKMDEDCVKRQNISFAELMEKAAKAAFDCVIQRKPYAKNVTILCGGGNNGGDGYVLALLFSEIIINVRVINIFDSPPKSEAALFYYNKVNNINEVKIFNAENLSDEILQEIYLNSDMIIDAVFGTGFNGELTGEALRVIKCANNINNNILKIAVDIPSGINCDDGTADNNSFNADLTITFEFIKRGLVSYPAAGFTGDIKVASIGFDEETRDIILNNSNKSVLLSYNYIRNLFDINNKRKLKNTNKGDFGKLLAVCGSKNMTGAAYFSAMGALRAGVGLLYLASEEKALDILQTKLNEPVFVPLDFNKTDDLIKNINNSGYDSLLIGPGLGIENSCKIVDIIDILTESDCVSLPETIIFDADGINALCGNINILNKINKAGFNNILTPHPGEMSRLCKAAGFFGISSPADVQKNRIKIALEFARKYNCVLVLKGANTVIACKNGDLYINPTGNPGMSKGGSGDILAGMIASYCAQGMTPEISACIAVYLHGLSGDKAAERYSETGMIPSDMLNILAEIQK